jgi:hypothetical protein
LATGAPGKPDFGLLGWNFGDFGNVFPDPRSSALIRGRFLFSSASSVPLCFKGFGFHFFAVFRIRFIRVHPWYGFG